MLTENLAQEIALIVLILLYGTVLAKLVPRRFHIILNIFIATIAIVLGYGFGLNAYSMGIDVRHIGSGIVVAFIASFIIFISTIVIALIPKLRDFFIGDNLARASGKLISFEATIRIPFSTALIEEVLFRGVLLGLLLSHYNTLVALIYASIVFGLWHVFPTIATLEQNDATSAIVNNKKRRATAGVVGAVVVTSIAGLFFGWLRILANSIIAPWLVHWSINSSGVVGIYLAKKLTNYQESSKK
jgi:membrane protease YdiL (CAAX protease family)